MRNLGIVALVVGVISLLLGVVSRFMMKPLPIAPSGVEAEVFLNFANTCLLAAIALAVLEKK